MVHKCFILKAFSAKVLSNLLRWKACLCPWQGFGIKWYLRSFLSPNHSMILWKKKREEAVEEAGLVPYITVWVFLYHTWNSGAGSHSTAQLLFLPRHTSFLGNTFITCPTKMPLGMVLDQADWNVGKSLSPPRKVSLSSMERTRETTYR